MGKDREKKRAPAVVPVRLKKAMPLLLLAVGIAFVCLIGGLVAKYVTSTPEGDNQVGARDFYFTLDLFSAADLYAGQDENQILERTVDLYGLGQNSLTFCVQNFFDDLRINESEIAYTVSWIVEGNAAATVTKNGTAVTSGTAGTLAGGSQSGDTYVVKNTAAEGGTVTVTVRSTAPYSKEMVLTIVFHPEQYDVLYRVEDAPGNAYATLIIMAGKEGGIPVAGLNIDWSSVNATANVLQIDTTNPYILNGDGGTLTVGMNGKDFLSSAQNTQKIEESGSIAIYFFKTDPSKDYSKADTVAELTDSKYQIVITENSVSG